MAAAASNTEGHGPTANASGCDRTKAPRPTRANVAAVLPPWRRLQVWMHQRPPAARTTPPRVREPVLDATAYPTISVPLATGAVGVDDMLGSVALGHWRDSRSTPARLLPRHRASTGRARLARELRAPELELEDYPGTRDPLKTEGAENPSVFVT